MFIVKNDVKLKTSSSASLSEAMTTKLIFLESLIKPHITGILVVVCPHTQKCMHHRHTLELKMNSEKRSETFFINAYVRFSLRSCHPRHFPISRVCTISVAVYAVSFLEFVWPGLVWLELVYCGFKNNA